MWGYVTFGQNLEEVRNQAMQISGRYFQMQRARGQNMTMNSRSSKNSVGGPV